MPLESTVAPSINVIKSGNLENEKILLVKNYNNSEERKRIENIKPRTRKKAVSFTSIQLPSTKVES